MSTGNVAPFAITANVQAKADQQPTVGGQPPTTQQVQCTLDLDGTTLDSKTVYVPGVTAGAMATTVEGRTITLIGTAQSTAGVVSVQCADLQASNKAGFSGIAIQAVTLDQIN